MIGPNNGPIDQKAIARPRLSVGIISAIVPLPIVVGATPAIPSRNRKTISDSMLGARALAMLNIRKSRLQVL
jgi:hypothetical protein